MKFYKTKWNFKDRSKDADALIYRHTTLEMIDFAKQYNKQQCDKQVVVKPFYCAAEVVNDPRCKKQCFDCSDEEIEMDEQ